MWWGHTPHAGILFLSPAAEEVDTQTSRLETSWLRLDVENLIMLWEPGQLRSRRETAIWGVCFTTYDNFG